MSSRTAASIALGLLGVVLLWSRTSGLTFGFWNDEAFSAFQFIDRGPSEIYFGAGVPAVHSLNNHRLFSLLAWATTALLGRSEVVYRLWAVVPGILSAVLITLWAVRRIGPWEGVVTGLLVATAPLHVELTTQARGYALGFLASALLPIGAARLAEPATRGSGALWLAIGGLVGIGSLSVFALPFTAETAVLLFVPGCARLALAVLAFVGLASLAFYWPVLALIASASEQQFGDLVTWRSVLIGPARDLLRPTVELVAPGIADGALLLLYGVVLAAAFARLWLRRRTLLLLLVVPIVATYASLALFGRYSVARYVSYLLLPFLALVATGLVELVRLAALRNRPLGWAAATALAGCAVLALLGFRRSEAERLSAPIEGYREALAVAREMNASVVVTNSFFGAGFDYYGRGLTIRFPSDAELQALFCGTPGPFVYVHYPLYGRPQDLRCLYARSPEAVPIRQRAGGFAGSMTVFAVR